MFNSQKSQIVVQTLAPYALAYSAICFMLMGRPLSPIVSNWERMLPVALFALGLSLLQDLIPRAFKEWLVFWRLKERLPGHRAFHANRRFSSVISRAEVRDISARETLGPRFQDRLFYQLYDKYREVGSVKHYSFRYLQWRELASFSLVCACIGYLVLSDQAGWTSIEAVAALGMGLAFTAICIAAARSASNSLIDYVLLAEMVGVDRDGVSG